MAEEKKPPSERTLERDIPELKSYLAPGANVLDIGCGEGTITLDVAARVAPGEVVGIDPNEEQIDIARAWAAQISHGGNITFQVGDSHRLDFPDETFDVVYSHTALHFFLDPVKALQEQKRVTKKGGWIIASGVRDSFITARYPPCPHWHQVWQALDAYWQSILKAFQASGDHPQAYLKRLSRHNQIATVYYDLSAGRKCPERFAKAGLADFQVKVKAEALQYRGSDYMEPFILDLLLLAEPTNADKELALSLEHTIAAGLLTEETLHRAEAEARAWYKDQRAFNFWALVFAAGRA